MPRAKSTARSSITAPASAERPPTCSSSTRRPPPRPKGKMISLATETERTLFFDFLPLALGEIRGFKTRFHLYTVPGQVFYDASRKLILKGVDGVVFVADSQEERLDANIESMENLKVNLEEQGYQLEKLPFVIQYNKRDLPNVTPVEELQQPAQSRHRPRIRSLRHNRRGGLRNPQGGGQADSHRPQERGKVTDASLPLPTAKDGKPDDPRPLPQEGWRSFVFPAGEIFRFSTSQNAGPHAASG